MNKTESVLDGLRHINRNTTKRDYAAITFNAIAKIEDMQSKIIKLEDREKHLAQVIYNVSKVSFEAGACYQKSDFHNEAVNFAKSMQANKLK